ncbi:amino acid permease/ SLC12A domain-containing protein [Melampsora americana]|nr:amino acid permease/ SLC12A domain-containing protein [Melampsora americana]
MTSQTASLPPYTSSSIAFDSCRSNSNEKDNGGGLESQGIPVEPNNLHRTLQNRHVAMISIGGAIGTGLFIGTGTALSNGGPASLVLGYSLTGVLAWALMCSLGEMICHLPIAGGHTALAYRFFSPSLGFALGWAYWYLWSICLATELAACAILIRFWTTKINPALWILIFLFGVALINLGGARMYGEMEFWFCSIKILTIVGVIILGIILDLGGVTGDRIGFRYWKDPGPFVQYAGVPGAIGRFCGFFSVFITAAFSYIGIETTAIAAAEAKNPRRNMPKAIKRVLGRVLVFYVVGTAVISVLVPSNERRLLLSVSTGAKSPFVIAVQKAGIKGLPSIINAALLTSAWSAASSNLYVSSRTLYGMSLTGSAPRFLSKLTSNGVPIYCYFAGIAVGALAFMSADAGKIGHVFGALCNMTSVTGLIVWASIFATYIRFHSGMIVPKYDKSQLPYQSPLGPKAAWCGLVCCVIIILTNGFRVFLKGGWQFETFFTCYFPVFAFILMALTHARKTGATFVPKGSMDFDTGSNSFVEEDEPPAKNIVEKVWHYIM